MVTVCGECEEMIDAHKKIAEERGLFDKLHLPYSQQPYHKHGENGIGDNMADIQKAKESEGIPYIGKKIYQEKGVKEIKILNEFQMKDCDYQGKITQKPVGKVATKIDDIKEAVWEMNKATQNWFVEKYGTDSSKWITGDWITIKLASAGNANPSIYPEACSLEKKY